MFTLRFYLRAAETGPALADLYAACVDMCAWAETRGAVSVILSEHHATEDNHLPPPLILAAAIAARTSMLPITLANTVEALRAAAGPYRIFMPDEAAAELAANRILALHPLCGGVPPDLAWPLSRTGRPARTLIKAVLPEDSCRFASYIGEPGGSAFAA